MRIHINRLRCAALRGLLGWRGLLRRAGGWRSGIRTAFRTSQRRRFLRLEPLEERALLTVSGLKSVGPTGDFQSLTAAITAIQQQGLGGATTLELQSTYTSAPESFPIALSNLGTTSTNTLTIRPASGATNLAITSANATATISFDAASFITIDGRSGGTGSAKNLTIENTNSSGSAIQFIDDSTNDLLEYATVKGANGVASTSLPTVVPVGVIFFGLSAGGPGLGNDNNTIDNCDIGDSSAGTPANSIYSLGLISHENSGNKITNSNIFNFHSATVDAAGVRLDFNNTDWTIQGNSFYQTATRTAVATNVRAIYVNNSSGNNFVVSDNVIGGSGPGASGTWTTTGTAAAYKFVGIQVSAGTTTASSIQDNTIKNFVWTTGSTSSALPGIWSGIYVHKGNVNVGTTFGNTIGSPAGTGSISTSTSGSGGLTVGIASDGGDTVAISNNTIGSITAVNTTGTNSASLSGINVTAGTYTISQNLVGSITTANSLNASSASTSVPAQMVAGISTSSPGSNVITGNTVANLNNAANASNAQIFGIQATDGVNTITGNTVRNISTPNQNANQTTSQSAYGIYDAPPPTKAGQTLSQNVVSAVSNTSASAAVSVTGIYYAGATSGTNTIARNFVHSLSLASTSASAVLNGMQFVNGIFTAQNNMVRVGLDASDANTAGAAMVRGIFDNSNTSSVRNFYHNSVYVGGAQGSGGAATFAFLSGGTSNTRDFRDNIFVNARANSGAADKHYAVSYAGNGNLTADNNIFFVSGTGGHLGQFAGADKDDIAAWRTATGKETLSQNADPLFINPTGDATTLDLHLQPSSPASNAGTGVGVTDDYDGQTRNATTPDIGADEIGSTSATLDGAGTLTITDSFGKDNSWTVSRDASSNLVITDANQAFVSAPSGGTLSNNNKTLTIPLSLVTGALIFDARNGNDTLTVDLSTGNPFPPGSINYFGGDPPSVPGDSLVITGGNQGTVTYNYTNQTQGSVVMSNFGTINYTGLEPITNSGTASDVVFNLPDTGDLAYLQDNGTTPTDGLLELQSLSGTFELTDFSVPSGSLTLNGAGGGDTLVVWPVPQFQGNLTINGGTGNDTVDLNGSINFAAGKNLNVDLQDDDASPGVDQISVNSAAKLVLSGAGAATLKASQSINLTGGTSLQTASGAILLAANQQATPTTGNFTGINIDGGTIDSASGDITLSGTGGTAGSAQRGVFVQGAGNVGGSTTGAVTVTGKGGAAVGAINGGNVGVQVDTSSSITAGGGNIQVTGAGGTDDGGFGNDYGMLVSSGGQIIAAGVGTLTVSGTGAASAGPNNFGILVSGGNALKTDSGKMTLSGTGGVTIDSVVTAKADIDVTGTSGSSLPGIQVTGNLNTVNAGNIKLTADRIDLVGSVSAETRTVTALAKTPGQAINLGGADSGTQLGLVDAELDQVIAGTLNIGDANSGPITVSADITRPTATAVNLTSGGVINFPSGGGLINTAGGNLTLTPGSAAKAIFGKAGADVNVDSANSHGTLSFAGGTDLAFAINGTTADSTYDVLNVTGNIDLSGADLAINNPGSFVPSAGDSFAIVKYTGSRGTSTFNSSSVLLNNVTLNVVYDDANKQVLLVAPAAGTLSATLSSGNLTITDVDATGKDNNLTVSTGNGNLVIGDSNEAFISAPAGGTLSNGNRTLTIPLTSVTGALTINGAGGNDTLTLDLSTGNPFPAGGISYSGGNPTTGPGDKLVITGGSQGTVTYNYTNAHDGSVAMSSFGTVTYTGLEPIVNSGSASDIVFNLPAGPNTATLGDDGTSNTLSRLSGSTFEQTDFANPSGTLTINRGNAADTLTVNALPDFNAGLTIGTAGSPFSAANLSGAVTLTSGKSLFAVASSLNATATGAVTVSGAGAINLTADNIDINAAATLTAAGNVIIQQVSPGRAVDLGTETAGQLSLTDAELDRITAGAIGIGDINTGPVTISATIDRAAGSTTTISLIAGNDNNIVFGSGGSLDAKNGNVTLTTNAARAGAIVSGNATTDIRGANLALVAGSGGIGASGNPLTFAATNLNTVTFGANQYLAAAGSVTINSPGLSASAGTIELDAGTFTLGGAERVNDATKLSVNGAAFGVSTFSETVGGVTMVSGSITGSGTLTSTTTYQTQSGSISAILAGSVGLTQTTTGTTVLSGLNSYSGDTTISNGTLKLGASGPIPDGVGKGNVVFNPASGNTATLDMGGFSDTLNGLTSSGAGTSVVDNTVNNGTISLSVGGNNATSTFAGVIMNTAGTLGVVKTGSGTLTISGANTYSGNTAIFAGTLKLGAANVIPDGAGKGDVNFNTTTTATLDLGGFSDTINGLSSAGTGISAVDNSVAGGPYTLIVANDLAYIFAGTIRNTVGTVGLTKTGSASLKLKGANTYTGPTTVNAGALLVDGSTAAGSAVAVNSGATLGGIGTVGGPITVNSGGHVAPGPGIAILNTGNLNLSSGSNFDADVGGTLPGTLHDQLNVAGTMSLGGATLNPNLSFTPVNGNAATIINNDSTDAVIGTFSGLPEGKVFTATTGPFTGTFQITYQGGTGNDVVLTGVTAASPSLQGTSGNDTWLVKRNGANDDITLNGTVIMSTPVSSLTTLTLNGLAGSDTLTVDSSAGDPFPSGGITFHGGNNSGDKLVVTGGSFTTITNNYTSTGPGHSGNIVFAGSQTDTLNYDGLAPIDMTGSTAANLVFNLPSSSTTANQAFLEDEGTTGNNIAQIRSNNGLFETTTFTNPSGSLSINRGGGSANTGDAVTVNPLLSTDFNAGLTIGSAGNEFSTVTFAGALTLATDKNLAANSTGTISFSAAASDIAVSGTGKVTLTTAKNISFVSGASITTVNGDVTLSANQQASPTAGNFAGISLISATITTNGTGNLILQGKGGNDGATNLHYGVLLTGSQLKSTASGASAGTITVTGAGGAGSGNQNQGVRMDGTTDVASVDGNVAITGAATQSTSAFQDGIAQISTATMHLTGTAGLTMTGTAGSTTGSVGLGLRLSGTNVLSGTQNSLIGDRMFLDPGFLSVTATGPVTLRPNTSNTLIDIGSATDIAANTLELSTTELGRITAPTLNIGSASSGTINVTNAITRSAATAFNLTSGGSINFASAGANGSINTDGGNLVLTPGASGSVGVMNPNTDATVSSGTGGTVSFGNGSSLAIPIAGTTTGVNFANGGYDQLRVSGNVNLTGANLALSGSYTPVGGDVFTIVNHALNVGTTTGTFTGLPESKVVSAVLGGSPANFQITYKGGAGNDVVLTALDSANPTLQGTTGNDTWLVKRNGANVDITLNGTVIWSPVFSTLTSLTINGLAGADTLTVDSSAGEPFPSGGITFHGGNNSGDKLITTGVPGGGSYTTITNNYTSTGPGHSGNIVFVGSQTDTLAYDGLAPIDISGSTATNLVFNLPPNASTAFLEDDGTTANGKAQLRSSNNTFETTVFANPSGSVAINPGSSLDAITVNNLPSTDFNAGLTIGAAGSEFSTVTFAGGLTLAANKNLSANATGTISLPNGASDLAASGTGAVTLTTARDISLSSGSSITSVDGTITLLANQQATPTSGNFFGVRVNAASIQSTGTGAVIAKGVGGDVGGSQYGVNLQSGGLIRGGLSGTQVVGISRGSTSNTNVGVYVSGGSVITATGAGSVIVDGTGGSGITASGVWITGAGSAVTSVDGDVQVTGLGGGSPSSVANDGVLLDASAQIGASGSGAVTVQGTGGTGSGGVCNGIEINTGASIQSNSGNVTVTGQAGGSAASATNIGIQLTSGQIIAGGSGTLTIQGVGGSGSGDHNHGIELTGSATDVISIASSGGNVQITGQGGGSGSSGSSEGVRVHAFVAIQVGGTGTMTIKGTGGAGTGSGNDGIDLPLGGSSINSSGGGIQITGIEGGGASGLAISGAIAASSGGGAITLVGNSMNLDAGSAIATSASSNVTIKPLTSGVGINLGLSTDPVGGPLGLTDAELDTISAGTINIGDANTGPITISAAIDRGAGSTTAINVTTGTNNSIAFTGNGSLDAKNGNVTLLTNSSGTGAITSGTSAVDIFGANVSLTAGSGGIGATGNPLVVSALNINATTGGNGNQFLSASGSTTIDATGLSAGTGTIELDGGTFTLGGSNRISSTSSLNVNGGTLALGANNQTLAGVTLTSGSVTGTSGVLTSTTTYQTQSGSISAILAGNVGLTQSTAGTTTLSGANTYTGDTTISGGTLMLGATEVIPDGSGKGNVVLNPASGTATLDLNGFIETVNGLSSSGAGSSIVDNLATSGSLLTIGNNNATSSFSGVIQNTVGTLALTKTGTGTLTLSGVNTYDGDTVIRNGTLKLGAANVIPDGAGKSDVFLLPTGGNTATLDLGGFNETINGLTNAGAGTSIIDNSVAGGPVTLTVGGNNRTSTFGGVIKNTAGTLALTKIGTGTLTLGGANTYSGTTTIDQGTLKAVGGSALPDTTRVTISAGATLDLGASETIGSLTGDGLVTNSVAATLTITSGGIFPFSGSINDGAGPLALIIDGANPTLRLSGASNYTGPTNVNAGRLDVSGSITSNVTVAASASLNGTGATGAVTVNGNGFLSPGPCCLGAPPPFPAILSSGNLTLSTDANFSVELAGTTVGDYDQQNVTGSVSLNGAKLSLGLFFSPTAGSKFTIIKNDSNDAVIGAFASLAEGQIFSVTTGSFSADLQITYQGGDGNDVVLTALNIPPTLNPIANRTVAEDAAQQTINLTGISSGGTPPQTLSITATSDKPGIIPNPTITYTSPNSTGTLKFQPNANQNGLVTITVTVQDDGGTVAGSDTFTRTFTVNVTEVNDPPVATPDVLSAAEDSADNLIAVLSNDSPGPNESSQTLTVTAAAALHGSVTINADGTLSYTPAADYNGPDTISYSIVDNGTTNGAADPLTADGTVAVTVTEVNDAPIAVDDSLPSVAEDSGDGAIALATLLANDSAGPANESSQTLTITAISNVVGGTAALAGDNIVFRPADDFNGTFSFVYTVFDNGATSSANDFKSDTATVSFTVTEVNDAPTGVDDTLPNILEDAGPQTIASATLRANDLKGPANESSQTLMVATVDSAIGGTVSLVGTDVIFTPAQDFNGTASFVYTLVDDGTTNGQPDAKVSTATVSFTVDAVNDAPIFVKGDDQAATDEDPATHGPALLTTVPGWATNMAVGPATATDEAGQSLSFTLSTDTATQLLFAQQPAVDPVTGDLTFKVAPNAHGTAHVSVTLNDDGGTAHGGVDASAPQTFDIVITKPHIWHNTKNALDVDGDDKVAPGDALAVINYVNAFGNLNSGHVPALGSTLGQLALVVDYAKPFGYLDVNGDDFVAPGDALAVINAINAHQGGEGETSQESVVGSQESVGGTSNDLMTLLAIDVASQGKRRAI